jgi:hypothetical protein
VVALSGGGTLEANGGTPTEYGGGGGGGRVAVYYTSLDGFDVANQVTAHGARGGSSWAVAGAVGTVYLRRAGDQDGELRIDSHGTAAGAWTPLGLPGQTVADYGSDSIVVSGAGVVVVPEHDMPVYANSLTLRLGAWLTHQYCTASATYRVDLRVNALTVDATARIDVSGRGYLPGRTVGNTTVHGATGQSSGSYGGRGPALNGTSNPLYGDERNPNEIGSGGGPVNVAGSGGGLVRITAASAQIDGAIRANGGSGGWGSGGSGSGGGILLNVGLLAGGGHLAATGGTSTEGGGGGGGGRIAVHSWGGMTLPSANLSAAGGTGPYGTGQPGSVFIGATPYFAWEESGVLLHGSADIAWYALGVAPNSVTVELTAFRGGNTYPIAAGLSAVGSAHWDTTAASDGTYELRALFRNGSNALVGELVRSVAVINDLVIWHAGVIAADETWVAGTVHVIDQSVVIPDGVTVTIEPGAVVKFAPGTGINILAGGTLRALATAVAPIVLTAVADDSAGGDTNLDGPQSLPRPGDWLGVAAQGGQFSQTAEVDIRYILQTHGGTLAASESWLGSYVHQVTGVLVVPSGVTLTVNPGAVVKFAADSGITVLEGGTLNAQGTLPQPITFTSLRDDTICGDSNGDGAATTPAAGDWRSLRFEVTGTASLSQVDIRYGGNSIVNVYGAGGMIEATSGALLLEACTVSESLKDGVLSGSATTMRNTVVAACDRGVCAWGTMQVINCTLDNNRQGAVEHGGTLTLRNSIVCRSLQVGVLHDWGPERVTVTYSDVWNPGAANYTGTADKTGQNGNLSVDPKLKNAVAGDYRLDYRSPCIDAADGMAAPATDFMGAPRYDDPRTANTGVPTAAGAYADLGAFEFVETAPSDLDLTVSAVTGPLQALAGESIILRWTVTNLGVGTVSGPWRDSVYLVHDPFAPSPTAVYAGDVLVGVGCRLGPGQSCEAAGTIRVPGASLGDNYWQVQTNRRGDVFEGLNTANNTATAAAPTSLDLPELTLGGAGVAGQFAAAGDTHWFRLAADSSGTGMLVRLDLAGNGVSEIYIRYGEPSSPDEWDFCAAGNLQADQAIQLPPSSDGFYYVTVVGAALSEPGQGFTMTVEPVGLSLTGVVPNAVGNAGRATLQIDGVELLTDAEAFLITPGGALLPAVDFFWWSRTRLFATFDLAGALPGVYAVQVIRADGSAARLDEALRVSAGTGGHVWTSIEAPAYVRAARRFVVVLEYGNDGDADAPAPPVTLQADWVSSWTLPDGTATELPAQQMLLTSPDGPPGTLRPGQRASLTFMATALEVDPEISVWPSLPEQDESPEQMIRNYGGDPAVAPWTAVRAALSTRFGSTHESYVQALANLATEYSKHSFAAHDQQSDVAALLGYAVAGALLETATKGDALAPARASASSRGAVREPYVPDRFDPLSNNDGFRLPDGRWIPPGFPKRLPTEEELDRYDGESNLFWNGCRLWFFQNEFDEWISQWKNGDVISGQDDWQAAVGSRVSNDAMKYLVNSDAYADQTVPAWNLLEDYLVNADVRYGTSIIHYVPRDPALGEFVLGRSANPILGRERDVTWNFGGGNVMLGKDASGNVVGFDVEVTRTSDALPGRTGDYIEWRAMNIPFRWEDKFTVDEHCVNPAARFTDGRTAYKGDPTWAYKYHYMRQTFGRAHPFNWIINMVLPERRGLTRLAGVVALAGNDITVMLPEGASTLPVSLSGRAMYAFCRAHPSRAPFVWTGSPDPADVAAPVVTLGAGTYTFTLTAWALGTRPPNPDYHESDQVKVTVLPADPKRKAKKPRVVLSHDPNDKAGPAGSAGYLGAAALMPYIIRFENDVSASAPAQDVFITDTLSPNLDAETWQLTRFGFGSHEFEIPAGMSAYHTTVDLRPDVNLLVYFEAGLHPVTREATWTFRSFDPATMEAPEDPFLGFLPPNDATHRGEGYVCYTVRATSGLASGTEVRNRARIVFDANPPIDTNETVNTIDITPPTSQVAALPAESLWDFAVTCSGSDAHAGVASYAVYARDNGGAWTYWTSTTTGTAIYTGEMDHTYGFYSVATDNAGNVETKTPTVEASTTVSRNRYITVSADPPAGGTVAGDGRYDYSTTTRVTATWATGYRFVNWTEDGDEVSTAADYGFAVTLNRSLVAHFRVAGSVPANGAFRVQVDAGTVATRGLWDLTGTYAASAKGDPLTLNLVHDPTGRLSGTATYTVAGDTAITMPIKGSLKGARGSITMKGSMRGADPTRTVSVALTLNLTVDTAHRQLVGRLTGSSKANGTTTPVNDDLTLAIPAPMDGTWTLRFQLAQAGRAVTGTAELTLSNLVRHTFVVQGRAKGTTAMLVLSGDPADPAAQDLRIRTTITPLEGAWARPESLTGKGYGQTVGW